MNAWRIILQSIYSNVVQFNIFLFMSICRPYFFPSILFVQVFCRVFLGFIESFLGLPFPSTMQEGLNNTRISEEMKKLRAWGHTLAECLIASERDGWSRVARHLPRNSREI